MALWDVLSNLVQRDARHLERIVIPPQNVLPAQGDAVPLAAGEGYFRLWVAEMFLAADREWFHTFYPVVQSLTTFQFGGGAKPVEIAQVAGPGHLQKVDPANLDKVIQVNHTLTPLVPFAGGTVQIEAGLLAMQADDLLQRFLDVVGGFSVLLAVPQLSTALGIASTVSDGVEKLLGVGSNRLVLGYQQTFAGSGGGTQLGPTHVALLNAQSGSTKPEHYWVKNGSLHYGSDAEQAAALSGVDYMLLRLETLPERDDWDGLAAINEPWKKAIDSLSQTDPSGLPRLADAETFVRIAAVAALNSPDLTAKDRVRVAKAIQARFKEYKAALGFDAESAAAGTPFGEPPSAAEAARAAAQ
ncbi:MAG: hypothetical protein ACRDJC_26450, partial [Thermomicrobiales bacterium]